MDDHYKDFSSILDKTREGFDLSRVFNDLLTMGICSFHKTNIQSCLKEQDAENERLYMQTIKPYKQEQLEQLAKAIWVLKTSVLESPYSDILGEYFMINITKGQNGQYFTPEHVCDLMANMQLNGS